MGDYKTTRLRDYEITRRFLTILYASLRVLMPLLRTWQSIEAIRLFFPMRILCLLRRALFGKDAGAPRMSGVTHVGPTLGPKEPSPVQQGI